MRWVPISIGLFGCIVAASCSGPGQVGAAPAVRSTAALESRASESSSSMPAATYSAPPAPTLSPTARPGAPMKPGDYDETIVVGGVTRTYILHVPPGYEQSTSLPLVFVLHGRGGTGKGMIGTGMSTVADQASFVVVYPDGTGDPRGWNSGLHVDEQAVDDVAFIQTLIDKLCNDLGLDRKRVYVAGFSAGAIMAYRLAAQISDQLAGIAVVEGSMSNKQPDGSWVTIPNPPAPVSAIIFHGKQDTHIPYDGGQGNGAGKLYVRPVTDAVSAWVKSDGCYETPATASSGNGNVMRQVYNGCAAGTEVVFYSIVNGQHEWPSVKHNGISATNLIWEFFSKHSK